MWQEEQIQRFLFEEREAVVIVPKTHANGRMLLKAEYFDVFPNFEEAMVEKGYHLCYVAHETRWAPASEVELTARFIRHVSRTYQLDCRCVSVGMSCGGLLSAKLAQAHPELISVLYLDAPVLNILSMAGLGEAAFKEDLYRELVATYGFNNSTVVNFRESPIDHMNPLREHRIPVVMLYGNADTTVIYEENGRVLEQFYRQWDLPLKVICKSACGHHPHGLEDPSRIVAFVEQHFPQTKTSGTA